MQQGLENTVFDNLFQKNLEVKQSFYNFAPSLTIKRLSMRKFLFGFLFFASLPTFAQDWVKTNAKGDELLGTSDRVVLKFEDNGNVFQFDENDDKTYYLKTSESFFDFTSIKGAKGRFTTSGVVGLYDKDKLIEKLEIVYEVLEPATSCYPNKYTLMGGNNLKRSKKVIDYIKNGKGYIRFILPLHLSTTNFDFKVPTLNQEE